MTKETKTQGPKKDRNKNISKISFQLRLKSKIFSERFWSEPTSFNISIGACAVAFAAEMTLFLVSAHFALRARVDALVRLENEEIDALLQGKSCLNAILSGFGEPVA